MPPRPSPYLSSSKTLVWTPQSGVPDIQLDLEAEEREIARLTKLIEPHYLNKQIEPQMAKTHLNNAINTGELELRALKKPIEALETVAAELVECGDCDELIAEADLQVRQVIEAMQFVKYRQTAYQKIKVKSSSQNFNFHKEFCQLLTDELAQWESLSLRQKFSQQPHYKGFRQRIWEASGSEGAMPNAKEFLPAENVEDEDDSSGDELEISGGSQNFKCPLCLGFLQTPLVSQLCQHSFCQSCFEGHLEQCRTPAVPCPTAGCNKLLTAATVSVDEILATRVRQYRRREEQRDAEQDFEDTGRRPQSPSQAGRDDKKMGLQGRAKSGSQKKKRVVVDDDDD